MNNVENLTDFYDDHADLVVGNHVWHWLVKQGVDDKALVGVRTVLNSGGIIAINTSSHLMTPMKYDIKDTSIFNHPIVRRFSEILQKKAKELGLDIPALEHPEPIFEREALIKQFEDAGFELIEYGEYLISVGHDPKTGEDNFKEAAIMLSNYHIGHHGRDIALHNCDLSEDKIDELVESARAETLEKAGKDMEHEGHIYDPNPKFVFRKT